MVTLQDIGRTCPAKAWAQHRFAVDLPLVNGQHIVVRFDIPMHDEEDFKFSPDIVAERFGPLIGESALDDDVLSAIADTLNMKMNLTYKTVALHLKLVAEVLVAIKDERYLLAFLMLRSLASQLMAYVGELWVYEWPEWVSLVEQFIQEKADPLTLKIVEKLLKDNPMQ